MKRSLSLFLVVAALLVGAAGGASAAKLITGKQIKNGTVTGADVRAGSLNGSDVKDGSLKGADLKDGSVGNADLADDSVEVDQLAYSARVFGTTTTNPGEVVDACDNSDLHPCESLVLRLVGPGTHLLTAKANIFNNGAAVGDLHKCGLYVAGQGAVDFNWFRLNGKGSFGENQVLSFQGLVTVDAITGVSVRCNLPTGALYAENVVLNTVKIAPGA